MLSAGNASATSEENPFFGDLQLLLFPQESPPVAHPDWSGAFLNVIFIFIILLSSCFSALNNSVLTIKVQFAPTLAEEKHEDSCGRKARLLKKRSEEHTSELQSRGHLVCRLL